LDVISWGFLFIGVNGASFMGRNNDRWVTGCSYVESVTSVGNVTFHCRAARRNYDESAPAHKNILPEN
jgi:hypothetical protein